MRALYVKKVERQELAKKWGVPSILHPTNSIVEIDKLFVMCNKDGKVKWETTAFYRIDDLIKRDNVKIIEL